MFVVPYFELVAQIVIAIEYVGKFKIIKQHILQSKCNEDYFDSAVVVITTVSGRMLTLNINCRVPLAVSLLTPCQVFIF